MFALTPWSLARRAAYGRRAVLLLVLAALLYGFGMHAAKACPPKAIAGLPEIAASQGAPCHHGEVDLAQAACEVHCRTDTQTGRVSLSFDLPAAAPVDLVASLTPLLPAETAAPDSATPGRVTGPPLHILLHRLLR